MEPATFLINIYLSILNGYVSIAHITTVKHFFIREDFIFA